ncbi:MAG: DUF3795 domain-containing protein [candidate division Zixibacteria bacterium]|nr:DUF3795 domain-containing protein [candidate division Zixibacteria bacterium]
MEKLISFCGINCSACPAYIATQKDDDNERKKVAETWSKQYEHEFKPEDINCDGCVVVEGRHISYCNECEIRKCGMEKKVENCAWCNDYVCEKLSKFIEKAPELKKNLEEIRKNR